ncbi:MAG: NYN domain-containing protein [Actinobacteria bacterium]|nr:NYN domain-containing protein [Actinomycetota bacterium]
MSDFPDDVAAALLRGIGTYIRELPPQELPAPLRRYRSFRPQALNAHRDTLLGVLDDDAMRARIAHWLETDKPPLSKQDAHVLRVATAREDGWEDALRDTSKPARAPKKQRAADGASLETERAKTRKAKDDLKRARDELRSLRHDAAARITELEGKLRDVENRLAEADEQRAAAHKEMERVLDRADRAERRSKTVLEKAQAERDAARKEAKELRREVTALRAKTEKAQAPRPAPAQRATPTRVKKRKPLRVPKGRLGDDPATLEKWLARDDVMLVIDGYNVAKADGGYEDLQLETQRERLVDAVFTLAKMTDTETIVVFDAQRVPGRRTRRSRRPVVVEWSNPGQIADDYIVQRLEELPQDPVVLVTNDKELQERGRARDATIATSQQLLALLR